MNQEAWTVLGWVIGAAVTALGGLKGVQAIQERRAANGNGHSPSPSTIRLQAVDNEWKQRVNRELFELGEGTVRGRFRHLYSEQLQPMTDRIVALETDRENDRAQLERIERRMETIQAMSIETNVLVKELRGRRRADREE